MGNPTDGDTRPIYSAYPFRFDKPPIDAVVDLINFSNKTHIGYGEIEVDRIVPLPADFSQHAQVNTSARIRMKGARPNAPSSTVTYSRWDIDEYVGSWLNDQCLLRANPELMLPEKRFLKFESSDPLDVLYDQLLSLYGIKMEPEDSTVVIGPADPEGVHLVTFVPAMDHLVWIGQVVFEAGPANHIKGLIRQNELSGIDPDQLRS